VSFALPTYSDITRCSRYVSNGPIGDIAEVARYKIPVMKGASPQTRQAAAKQEFDVNSRFVALSAAFAVLASDQLTKHWALMSLATVGTTIKLTGPIDLTLAPRITILSASSGNGRCNALASSHGARIPNVAFLISRHDHRHGLWMDRRDVGVRHRRQETIDQMGSCDGAWTSCRDRR
jgi:hypothetical protein